MRKTSVCLVAFLTIFANAALAHEDDAPAQPYQGEFGYIGTVDLPITCANESVQEKFNYALAQYCHMSYETARAAFASLLGDDPNCAMAFWGIAITHTAPVWPMTPTEASLVPGSQAIAHARRLAENATERERLYIEAAAALYDDWETVPYSERLRRWLSAQEVLYNAHPDDDEAAVFYALALVAVGDSEGDTEFIAHQKAGKILEEIFTRKQEHPGVIHYTIHAYDKPPLAERAVQAARAYANVAPNIAHANHMPTHIFTRLGYWEDSKLWNVRAQAAAKELLMDGRVYGEYMHATDYIVYADLQTGHDAAAVQAMEQAAEDGPHMQNFVAAYALSAIPARIALEKGDWQRAAALEVGWAGGDTEFDWSGQEPSIAVTRFARGVGAALSGNVDAAKQELEALRAIHQGSLGTQRPFWSRRIDIQARAVDACIAYAEGKHELALTRLRAAANREDENGKHPVMPAVALPIRELYADLSMQQGNYEAALSGYRMNLKVRPGRFNSLGGAGRAADLLGKHDEAREYYSKLVALAGKGDTDRPQLQHARAYLDR